MNLGSNCEGEPKSEIHYDFAVKLNLKNTAANLSDLEASLKQQKDLNDSYGCKIEVIISNASTFSISNQYVSIICSEC